MYLGQGGQGGDTAEVGDAILGGEGSDSRQANRYKWEG